ncbi:PadR family transcriptional regulator [Paenibacillus arenilitoris]|uniref:PadR family transcriptional regulator n=1 Tax=Paenibacillus arenilitoris TaxID=2772299 RepID=A0A927CUD5_9BACL|nr:PadR family transcriptional regulator [Paenibacillus arenilitoris]MBD2871735.1 PadR family transcriptional regulator [Paenibacillus arenilitoris]
MPKQKLTNPLALAILSLLQERPMHPYEAGATMKQRGMNDVIKLNTGSLYAIIETLLKKGLIQPVGTEREGKHPERTIYEPTPAGTAVLFDWIRSLVRTPAKEYPQFAAGLAFLGHLSPEEAVVLLEERCGKLSELTAKMRTELRQNAEHGLDRLFVVEQEYALALNEAELRWVDALIGDIRGEVLTKRMNDKLVWAITYQEQ